MFAEKKQNSRSKVALLPFLIMKFIIVVVREHGSILSHVYGLIRINKPLEKNRTEDQS